MTSFPIRLQMHSEKPAIRGGVIAQGVELFKDGDQHADALFRGVGGGAFLDLLTAEETFVEFGQFRERADIHDHVGIAVLPFHGFGILEMVDEIAAELHGSGDDVFAAYAGRGRLKVVGDGKAVTLRLVEEAAERDFRFPVKFTVEYGWLPAFLPGLKIENGGERLEEERERVGALRRIWQVEDGGEGREFDAGLASEVVVTLQRGDEGEIVADERQHIFAEILLRQEIADVGFEFVEGGEQVIVQKVIALAIPLAEFPVDGESGDGAGRVRQGDDAIVGILRVPQAAGLREFCRISNFSLNRRLD